MKALAALSLISSFAVGGEPGEQSPENHPHDTSVIPVSSEPTVAPPPQHLFSTEPVAAPSYVGWDKFNNLSGDEFDKQVMSDPDHVWVVAYVHPSCSSCGRLSNEWEDL